MRRLMTMREALEDPDVLGSVLLGETWQAWRVVLIASQGEPLTDDERVIFTALTGREREPEQPCREVWGICGRRAGKTRAFSVAAAYFARLIDYTDDLAPGQRGRVPVMAARKDTAREAYNYIRGIFDEAPDFRDMLDGEPTADTIRLSNRIDIQIMAADHRALRGPTPVAAIGDECAFWAAEGAMPDVEVFRGLRPGLATFGSPLFVLSSPYARRGALWDAYRKHYGPNGNPRILVLQAATQVMHKSPSLAEEEAEAYREDPVSAAAEWGALFRTDSEAYITLEAVQACMPSGVREIPPASGISYYAFVDVSGARDDSSTIAIAHKTDDLAILDAVREVKGGSPDAIAEDFSVLCKSYGLTTATGDNYGAEWVQERFRAHGITYEKSGRSKSDIYREFLPILNSERCRLLDVPKLESQLVSLERKTSRGTGRDIIDHPQVKGAHDDIANSVAGALVLASVDQQRVIEIPQEAMEWAKNLTFRRRR